MWRWEKLVGGVNSCKGGMGGCGRVLDSGCLFSEGDANETIYSKGQMRVSLFLKG